MEVRLEIGYPQLLQLLRQLPPAQLAQLIADVQAQTHPTTSPEKQRLQTLLLNGPVMTDDQFAEYQENRKWMNEWRVHE